MWDDYEGFAYGTFIIWRYDPALGAWDSLDAVPSNLHSYTDLTPPTPLVNVNYFIEVIPPSVCTASIANPDDARQTPELMVTNLNSSRSNIYKINPTPPAAVHELTESSVHIYPNPSNGQFKVQRSKFKVSKMEIKIFDVIGNEMHSQTLNSEHGTLNLNLANGIYFLQLKSEDGVVTKKIVINK